MCILTGYKNKHQKRELIGRHVYTQDVAYIETVAVKQWGKKECGRFRPNGSILLANVLISRTYACELDSYGSVLGHVTRK
jgi:FMN-dependent NADH-azoreductase